LRVLILEDELAISTVLEAIVEETVPSEVSIHDSVESAEKVMDRRFDFALLDINLTNGRSYEIAKRLLRADVPFSFVSGSTHQDMPDELQAAPFIAKPFRHTEIRDAVLAAQRRKRDDAKAARH
jgi:DNA-binding response OmpR family regulator